MNKCSLSLYTSITTLRQVCTEMLATLKQNLKFITLVYLCTSWNENAHKRILCEQFEKGRILICFFNNVAKVVHMLYIQIQADLDYTQSEMLL